MKIKKFLVLIVMVSMILMFNSTEVFGWLQQEKSYSLEVCNIINECISGVMRIIALIIGVTYVTMAIRYIRYSKRDAKQKRKNLLISLIIVITQIMVLFFGAVWVKEVGMEPYIYRNGTTTLFNIIIGDVSNLFRILAFVLIIYYIIKSVIYFVTSKKENKEKIKNLAKWEFVTSIIVIMLLVLARRW